MARSLIEFHAPVHLLGFDQHLLVAILIVAGFASAAIVVVAAMAYNTRRTWSYLLVTLALTTLLVRTLIGLLTTQTLLDPMSHHILEHGLDIVTVLLLIGAIYFAKTIEPTGDNTHE